MKHFSDGGVCNISQKGKRGINDDLIKIEIGREFLLRFIDIICKTFYAAS